MSEVHSNIRRLPAAFIIVCALSVTTSMIERCQNKTTLSCAEILGHTTNPVSKEEQWYRYTVAKYGHLPHDKLIHKIQKYKNIMDQGIDTSDSQLLFLKRDIYFRNSAIEALKMKKLRTEYNATLREFLVLSKKQLLKDLAMLFNLGENIEGMPKLSCRPFDKK